MKHEKETDNEATFWYGNTTLETEMCMGLCNKTLDKGVVRI